MLCADGSPGRCPKTLSESFAAERSLPNEANGCSRSAATKYSLAALSCSSLPVTIGRPGRVTFTVARWAHPQEPNKIRAKAKPVRICSVPLDAECRDFMESDACLRRPYGLFLSQAFPGRHFRKQNQIAPARYRPSANYICGRGRCSGGATRYDAGEISWADRIR